MKKLFIIFTLVLLIVTVGIFASAKKEIKPEDDVMSAASYDLQLYGAMAVKELDNFTLEEMLRFSLEDERLALAEYEMIINDFQIEDPFLKIIEAEKVHIGLLLELYTKYNFEVPVFNATEHLVIPGSLNEIFEVGIDTELMNIAMYDKFLGYDLQEDIRVVFTKLRDGSVNHLASYKKQLTQN